MPCCQLRAAIRLNLSVRRPWNTYRSLLLGFWFYLSCGQSALPHSCLYSFGWRAACAAGNGGNLGPSCCSLSRSRSWQRQFQRQLLRCSCRMWRHSWTGATTPASSPVLLCSMGCYRGSFVRCHSPLVLRLWRLGATSGRLTIHSSRRHFVTRLNSSVSTTR